MADNKTNLRELSVGVGIYQLLNSKKLEKNITVREFFLLCKKAYSKNPDFNTVKNQFDIAFNSHEKGIISNGYNLSAKIVTNFNLSHSDKIIWTGLHTQSGLPVDLVVGNFSFSLKEDSFILENMGLYKYLNLITTEKFKRGLHIFKIFAKDEYQQWFDYSWEHLINSHKEFNYKSPNYSSAIKQDEEKVYLILKKDNKELTATLPRKKITLEVFEKLTTSATREKVFAKWIKSELEKDVQYNKIKKNTSVKAGERLVALINDKLDETFSEIKRLLQVYTEEYYYAKTNNGEVKIFKVPADKDFKHTIKIKSISAKVPKSQLNLYTELENTKTKKKLLLRNEIRFSHGQFNGTPEAKMYYSEGGLENIYEEMC